MKPVFALFLALFLAVTVSHVVAQDDHEDLITALSKEKVGVSSNFTGTEIVVFGSVEKAIREDGHYDVIVTVSGPTKELTVRKKSLVAGIWINSQSRTYSSLPSSYMMFSSRALDEIGSSDVLRSHNIGPGNLGVPGSANLDETKDPAIFRKAALRIMQENGLYQEVPGGVEFMSRSLFRAVVPIPANIPIGAHTIRVYLFQDGDVVTSVPTSLRIEKTGFERFAYHSAHNQPFLYGVFAVILAMATGWFASVVFKR